MDVRTIRFTGLRVALRSLLRIGIEGGKGKDWPEGGMGTLKKGTRYKKIT